jgi:hypothetical protein
VELEGSAEGSWVIFGKANDLCKIVTNSIFTHLNFNELASDQSKIYGACASTSGEIGHEQATAGITAED